MLEFVDTQNEEAYQDRNGLAIIPFGVEFGINTRPLDFQYPSTETITSFVANKINPNTGVTIETITLPTNLISIKENKHYCSGIELYGLALQCGYYEYIVNGRYQSDVFKIIPQTCIVILSDIAITGAIENSTANISFDAKLTGLETLLDVDFEYTFSCPITSISTTETLTNNDSVISQDFAIPVGVSGSCTLTITNNLCSSAQVINFDITQSSGIGVMIIGSTFIVT